MNKVTKNRSARVSAEERYKTFIERSAEGIWLFELEKPLRVTTSVPQQIKHFYTYAFLAECNDAFAKMYGHARAADITGARLGDLLPAADSNNVEYLRAFIEAKYALNDAISHEVDRDGNAKVFRNNLIGIVESGRLLRAWGTQRDITVQHGYLERQHFLETINQKLVVSLNHTITLQDIARLIVPYLADYCRIAIINEQNELQEIAVNHTDPSQVTLVKNLYESYKDIHNAAYGLPTILRSGKSEIIPELSEKVLRPYQNNPDVLRIIKEIGLTSYMGVPLQARGKVIGAITFSSVRPNRKYTVEDLRFAEEIARRVALVLDNNRLFQEAQEELLERKKYERNLTFLAEASKILASSLDYLQTLSNVVRLAVPVMADWCAVDILDGTNIRPVSIMHKDPKKVKWALQIRQRYPPRLEESRGVARIFRDGKPELYPEITEAMLAAAIPDQDYLALIRKVGMVSVMLVPIVVRGTTFGVISFISSDSTRTYTRRDLTMAEEVASRASLAVENSMLYAESQKAVAVRDDFISIASHELKTPVTSLKMYTQVLQKQMERKGEVAIGKSLANMDIQINKLTGLITDLLDISKMQMGKLEFSKEQFDLTACLREAVRNIQPLARQHALLADGPDDPVMVWGDKDRIGQVLINLLTNAIKYSPRSDKVVISVKPGKETVTVSVRDFGIGIGPEHHERIFERFYRVSAPSGDSFPGLGIGLYISNEIVKRHGGHMTVASKPGRGSTFSFTIPYTQT